MVVLNTGHYYHVQGGSDRCLFALEALLEARGHQVIPFASAHEDNHATPWSKFFPPGVDGTRPGLRDAAQYVYSRPARLAIRRLLDTAHVDLAHLHIYYGHLTASILSPLKDAGIPIVQSLHEYKLVCPVYTCLSGSTVCEACAGRHFWRALPRRCKGGSVARTILSVAEAYTSRLAGDAGKVDHFIAVSDFMRKKVVEHGVVPESKVTHIPNFVDASSFEPGEDIGRYVLYFGRLAPAKGVRTLIDAVAPLTKLPLLIVGTGPQDAELQQYVSERGLSQIRFLGFKSGDALYTLIRDSLCVVLPAAWYENCPMSVLESFALGRPVIGTDIGGIPELIEVDGDGFLFPVGDEEALREKLVWFSEHPEDARAMGKAGRRKVEERFGAASHYEQLMTVYNMVL